jgi:hypothetical protein
MEKHLIIVFRWLLTLEGNTAWLCLRMERFTLGEKEMMAS